MFRTASSILSLSLLLISTACGFHPVYGETEKGNVTQQMASVHIENMTGREGQVIKTRLQDLLNPANTSAPAAYSLKIEVRDQHSELGINTDLRVTRYDVIPIATYHLIRLEDNKEVDKGHIRIKSSYNRTTSEFATYVAEQDSTELADREVAEEIRSHLIYYFNKINQ